MSFRRTIKRVDVERVVMEVLELGGERVIVVRGRIVPSPLTRDMYRRGGQCMIMIVVIVEDYRQRHHRSQAQVPAME